MTRHASLLWRQVRAVNRAFWRNPASAFFTFAFPLVFMIILDLVFATGGGEEALIFYTPRDHRVREVAADGVREVRR